MTTKSSLIIKECGCCKKEFQTTIRAVEGSKSGLVFCSKSCSAKITNSIYKKKKSKPTFCKLCSSPTINKRKLCLNCYKHGSKGDITLEEAIYFKHHKSSAFALVRSRARASNKIRECELCGYSKHVEVCHKRPISDFPLNTKISEINNKDNILVLCPNCHWEFDHPKNNY